MEGMTDKQFETMLDLIIQTVKDSKSIEDAVQKLEQLKERNKP